MNAPLFVRRTPATRAASGPPVLFVHGLASRGRVDWPHAEWSGAFPDRDVLVVDLPAHGKSFRPSAPLRTSAIVDLLHEVVSDAGGEVDVVAYSLGSRLSWDLAARGGVRRAVLGGLSPFEAFAPVDVAGVRTARAGGSAPADPLTAMILGMVQLPGLDPAAVLLLIEGLASEPFDPAALVPGQGVGSVPVLFIRGRDDELTVGLDELAARVPEASFAEVPGDHLRALHTPEFRAAAQRFLTS